MTDFDECMDYETAVRSILVHGPGSAQDGSDCRDNGFLGCLRPYSKYRRENFFELLTAITSLAKHQSNDITIDRGLIRAMCYIPATARRWALDPDSMLQRNRLIPACEAAELLLAVHCLEMAIDRLLSGRDPAAAIDWYRQHSNAPTNGTEGTMEITGYDNVVFTTAEPRGVTVRFFEQLRSRWPAFLVDIDSQADRPAPGEIDPSSELPTERGEFSVVRDAAMDQFSDENGYALMSDGEGPLLLIYERVPDVDYGLEGVIEPASPPGEVGVAAPYKATLCCREIWRFTLVTPNDPSQHSFSESLYQRLCDQCLADDSNGPLFSETTSE